MSELLFVSEKGEEDEDSIAARASGDTAVTLKSTLVATGESGLAAVVVVVVIIAVEFNGKCGKISRRCKRAKGCTDCAVKILLLRE
jgi:hypothetical protein